METNIDKKRISNLLKKSITLWLFGFVLFFVGFWGTFNPASPSPEFLFVVFILSMPIVVIGFIMTIVYLIKFLKK